MGSWRPVAPNLVNALGHMQLYPTQDRVTTGMTVAVITPSLVAILLLSDYLWPSVLRTEGEAPRQQESVLQLIPSCPNDPETARDLTCNFFQLLLKLQLESFPES